MGLKVAVIAGSGLAKLFQPMREVSVSTPYGRPAVFRVSCGGVEAAFIPRHGVKHTTPPHKVNYRANIYALKKLGVECVIATSAVGSMNRRMKPGAYVVPDQFIDFTKARRYTFYDGGEEGVVHTDVSEPYSREVRRALVQAGQALQVTIHDGGVYVCTEGPRFETPAEIRMLRRWGGDMVGMTGVPEVVLANELQLRYATLGTVTNWAAGMQKRVSHAEVLRLMKRLNPTTKQLIAEAVKRLKPA